MGTRPLGQALPAHVRRASGEHAQGEIPNIGEETVGKRVVIIENIANGDADAAERALQMNWRNGAERLGRVIDTLGERGSW